MARRDDVQARRARAAELQAEARRAERRRNLVIVGVPTAVAAVIIGAAAFAVVDQMQEQDEVSVAAQEDIEGVRVFEDLSNNHVSTRVDYPQTPSVGGDHADVWTNCGVYTSPVDPMQATHSLEHGAVWIGYEPGLDDRQVKTLTDLTKVNDYVVLSPVEGVPSPVTLSAWGHQLELDTADDPRLEVFIEKYQQGEQTLEPGAPYSGGVGSPA